MATQTLAPRICNVSFALGMQTNTLCSPVTIFSAFQKPSVNNSGTGVDQGLVSLLRPQQNVYTWYLRAVDADQVLSTAVSLSYTEKGTSPWDFFVFKLPCSVMLFYHFDIELNI